MNKILLKLQTDFITQSFGQTGFLTYTQETPAHRFHCYAGSLSNNTLLKFCFRDLNSFSDAKLLIETSLKHASTLEKLKTCAKIPTTGNRFDGVLYIAPNVASKVDIESSAIDAMFVFNCEFTGNETVNAIRGLRRHVATIDLKRDPEPQLAIQCTIPKSKISIPQWSSDRFSSMRTYLKILLEHGSGSMSIRNINLKIIEVDLNQTFDQNLRAIKKHVYEV